MANLISVTDRGLYCAAGDFYIDPWKPVPRAVITHAHGDHARRGSDRYLTTDRGLEVLKTRMDANALIDTVAYGETVTMGNVHLSLHPAGHILGSAQVRVECQGEVWVVSGDYKITSDQTCEPFTPITCDTFISECTFGLPIYRWPTQEVVVDEINRWWRTNRDEGRASVIFAYSLGKAQRVIAGVDPSIGPIICHGAVQRVNVDYRNSGVVLPPTAYAGAATEKKDWRGALIIAPPSANGTPWMRKFGEVSAAFASGWMQVRGTRRRRAVDRGFVVSDHADWPGLLSAIQATAASRVLLTHGKTGPMVRWLREMGVEAASLHTEYVGERDDIEIDAVEADTLETNVLPPLAADVPTSTLKSIDREVIAADGQTIASGTVENRVMVIHSTAGNRDGVIPFTVNSPDRGQSDVEGDDVLGNDINGHDHDIDDRDIEDTIVDGHATEPQLGEPQAVKSAAVESDAAENGSIESEFSAATVAASASGYLGHATEGDAGSPRRGLSLNDPQGTLQTAPIQAIQDCQPGSQNVQENDMHEEAQP